MKNAVKKTKKKKELRYAWGMIICSFVLIGFTVAGVILKLSIIPEMSWESVFRPLWMPGAAFGGFVLVSLIMYAIKEGKEETKNDE